jgi:hypothetical protein
MARWLLAAVVIGLGVVSPGSSAAQTMFLQVSTPCGEASCLERRFTVSLDPLGVTAERLVASGSLPTYVTPDGRFGVVVARPSSATSAFAVSDLVAGGSFEVVVPGVREFVGSPVRTELYASDASGVLALSVAGLRRFAFVPCGPVGLTPESISGDGSRVAFSCGSSGQVYVFNTISGNLVGALPATSFALDADGSHGYAIGGVPTRLRRLDVATATEVAQAAVTPGASTYEAVVDPRTGRVVLHEGEFAARLFDPALQFLRFIAGGPGTWTFDPSRARAYQAGGRWVENSWGLPPYCQFSVTVVDAESWTPAGSATTTGYTCPAASYAFTPAPPTNLAGTVAGSTVALSWAASAPAASVTRYVLEAGSAPGLANIATFGVGLQTALSVGAVPPGTYYVRVRAANYVGTSLPSNEVVVVVP